MADIDPAVLAPYREHRFRSADTRLTLFARDYPSTDENAGRAPLLMMHGLTRNSADFEPLIERLGIGQRRMVVPDQRGRGRSDYDAEAANYRPDVYVKDMWHMLDQLAIEQVICVGTSMGGLMAMVMGAEAQDRIAGIVLNDVGPEVSEEGLGRIRSYVGPTEAMASWEESAARCKEINSGALPGLADQEWMAFAQRTCHQLPNGRVNFAYDPAIAAGLAQDDPATVPPDLWALWSALETIPILAIRGAHSDILTAATLEKMTRARDGNLTCMEVAERGHAPLLNEPAAANAIREFLTELA